MPLITDLIKKETTKKFKKKEYRPWDVAINTSEEEVSKSEDSDKIEVTNIAQKLINKEKSLSDLKFSTSILEKEWRNLYGAKKEVLIYIINRIEEDSEDKVITENIMLDHIVNELKLAPNTIKGALQQLKKANFISTEEKKPGRGGYARYKILKNIYTFFQAKIKNI